MGHILRRGDGDKKVKGQGGRAGAYVGLPFFFLTFYFLLFIPLVNFLLNYPGGYID